MFKDVDKKIFTIYKIKSYNINVRHKKSCHSEMSIMKRTSQKILRPAAVATSPITFTI